LRPAADRVDVERGILDDLMAGAFKRATLTKDDAMSDPIDALMAEVLRTRTEAKPFRVTATEVFRGSVDRLDSQTLNALKDTGRAFVARSRAEGITMWRLTNDAPELELPDDNDLDQLVWIGFLVIATERAGASLAPAAAADRSAPKD
jgi:hypothetical protein